MLCHRGTDGDSHMRRIGPLVLAALIVGVFAAGPEASAQSCENTSTGLVPLTDLTAGTYLGEPGGLYPDGSNELPVEHLTLGLAQAELVVPRNAMGVPDSAGLIGMISIGVSNTFLEFNAFLDLLATTGDVNPRLVVLNGAQGSRALEAWAEAPDGNPWRNLEHDLERAGLTAQQVQVAWVKLPPRARGTVSLDSVEPELADMRTVLNIAHDRYPNLRLAYLSSRIYAHYSPGADAEPKAYQNGFAVKWLIEEQLEGNPQLNADPAAGPVMAPWIAWGPYLWSDGTVGRDDGLVYECSDLGEDGIHPGPGASDKVARLLYDHLASHPTSRSWFVAAESTDETVASTVRAQTPTVATPVDSSAAASGSEEAIAETSLTDEDRSPGLLVGVAALGVLIGIATGSLYERRQLVG